MSPASKAGQKEPVEDKTELPSESARRYPSRLRYTPEDDFRREIEQHHSSPQIYAKLAQRLQGENAVDFEGLNRLSNYAVDQKNLSAVVGIARVNKFAVVNALQNPKNATIIARMLADPDSGNRGSNRVPIELYYLLRASAPKELKLRLKRVARQSIYTATRRISHIGLRPDSPKKMPPPYQVGNDFDVDETLEYVMDTHPTALAYTTTYHAIAAGKPVPFLPPLNVKDNGTSLENRRTYAKPDPLTHNDIVSIIRQPRTKAAILLLDTSGSMYGEKLPTAAITATVLANHLRNDYYAIITFNRDATALKTFQRKSGLDNLADDLLDLQPAGYTNIAAALRLAQKQIDYLRTIPGGASPSYTDTWTILITDGYTNRGPNPIPLAMKIPILHVIQTPPPTSAQSITASNETKASGAGQPRSPPGFSGIRVASGETNPFELVSEEQLDPATRLMKKLAQVGHGRYVKLTRYDDIPWVLSRILAER